MTKLIEKFRNASYRGVEFTLWTIGHTQLKKNTEHQFANTSRRYIEERGVQGKDFELTLSIFGNGETYTERRDKLRSALAEEGSGLLVLPFEGEYNAKCTGFSDSQTINDGLGRCDFSATFKVTGEKEQSGNPTFVKDDKVALANKTSKARQIVTSLTDKNISINSALNYGGVLAKMNNVTASFSNVIGSVTDSASMTLSLDGVTSQMNNIIGGGGIGTAVNSLFIVFETTSTDAGSLFQTATSFFNFGDSDVVASQITPERVASATNNKVINTQMQVSATAIASNALANTDFSNTEDLDLAGNTVKEQITKLLKSDILASASLDGSSELLLILKTLRVDLDDVIASKSVDTPNVITVPAKCASMSLLAYQYYDSLDEVSSLLELNNMSNAFIDKKEVKIFTNV